MVVCPGLTGGCAIWWIACMSPDCAALQWEVNAADQLIQPKALPHALRHNTGLEQLETLSQYVLHLEQNTVVKLP